MTFDRLRLEKAIADGPVARVVVAETRGSVPREVGADMLVGPDWQKGTIGGGALEFEAVATARDALSAGRDRIDQRPLGPALGQCCGGAVTLLTEIWDRRRLERLSDAPLFARPVPGNGSNMPLPVKRLLAEVRNGSSKPTSGLVSGWMVEFFSQPQREIWIWGAGHVGRAIVSVLAPSPNLQLFWADCGRERFPDEVPEDVELLVAENPAELVSLSGPEAEHYVLTYSHALDLEICHRVLGRGFSHIGLIGSATKRARFRSRLSDLGHRDAQIDRIACPIGDPALGKRPQEIALGVATEILRRGQSGAAMIEQRA